MVALANQLMGNVLLLNCPSRNRYDATCFNDFRLLQMWMLFTPQFPLIIILISSPLALLAALWGMTGARLQRSRFTSAWRQDNKARVLCVGSARRYNMLHDVQHVHVKGTGGMCAAWEMAHGGGQATAVAKAGEMRLA